VKRQFSNRQVLNRLRTMQQQMRELSARMDAITRAQQRLALNYLRNTATFTLTEVRRG
jgi:hypothetical protein